MNSDERPDAARTIRFDWRDLPEQLDAFAQRWPGARVCGAARSLVAADGIARLWLPLAAAPATVGEPIGSYAARAADRLGRQVVLLLQAGAVAFGCWEDDELVDHKAIRKYVVRGKGRAQPTHLKTRGKSRYGSRLRLQNWKRLLVATNERLDECWRGIGAPARVFFSAPVRAWPELWSVEPPPPFARDDATLQRVPIHVHRPDHEELLRVRRWLLRGCVELPTEPD